MVPRIPRFQTINSAHYRLLSLWLPVIAWAALIFHFSSIPNLRITEEWYDLILRKLAHLFFFGGLAWWLSRAFTGTTVWTKRQVFYTALGLTFLYACSDEFHQSFVAGRRGSIVDIGIDTTGAWAVLWLKSL